MAAETENNYVWRSYGRHYWFSNGKSRIYDHKEFDESVSKWLQQQPTTENSDMAAKTGNTYISGKVRDRKRKKNIQKHNIEKYCS